MLAAKYLFQYFLPCCGRARSYIIAKYSLVTISVIDFAAEGDADDHGRLFLVTTSI